MTVQNVLDFFAQWHLTERCNLRCRHCYQDSSARAEMPLPEIMDGVDEIARAVEAWSKHYGLDLGLSFTLTGGEPFLRVDFLDVVAGIRERGWDVFVLTNGVLVSRREAERLAGLGVRGVQVSLEGTEAVHDGIRGKGSYRRALRGVQCLQVAGLPVTLNATLSEINAGHIREMVDLAADMGVARLGFSRLVPSGRGLALADRMLAPDRLKELYREVFALDTGPLAIVTGDPVAARLRDGGRSSPAAPVPVGGCAAAFAGITILSDGTLLPCRRLPVPVGNIREDSFREVWAASPVLRKLRDRRAYKGKCGKCPRWAVCRGCRAVAWAASAARGKADYLAPDPQCFLGN